MAVAEAPLVLSPRSRSLWSRRGWTGVALSSLAVAAYFGGQYVQGFAAVAARSPGINSAAAAFGHRAWPIEAGLVLHIVGASFALALGPIQFSVRLRTTHRRLHRAVGRGYLLAVAAGAAGGVVTSAYSMLGLNGFFGFGTLDVLWVWTAYRAYSAARTRNFREHQAWMIRNFALTYAAVTLRVGLAVFIAVQLPFGQKGGFPHTYAQAYGTIAPYLGWLINLVVAESMVRRRDLPALRMTDAHQPAVAGTRS